MRFNTALVQSINNEFESYEIKHIVNIIFAYGVTSITYIDKDTKEVKTNKYSCNDVIINIA